MDSGTFIIPPTPSPPSTPLVLDPLLQVVENRLPTEDVPRIAHISEPLTPADDVHLPHIIPIVTTPPPFGMAEDDDKPGADTVSRGNSTSTLSSNAGPSKKCAPKKKKTQSPPKKRRTQK